MKMMRFIKPRRKSLVARIRQRRLVATAWVAAGAIGFVLTFLLIHIPEGPAHWSADLLMTYVPRAPTQQRTDIALIYVTEETLAPYPYVAPIDRGFLADLVRAVDQADVKAIGLDFVFDRETEAAKDDDLVAAIRNAAHPVVLGGLDHRSPMSEATRTYQHSFFERVDRAPGHSAKIGHLYFDQHRNPFIISDHVVRSIAPADGEYPKSFAEMLAGADGQPRTVPSAYISWQSEHADGKGLLRRLWDALAMLLIVAGTTLFLMARNGLASLASGPRQLPAGVQSFVQRADYFSAQSSLGLGLIGLGIVVGLGASIRHALRRRAQSGTPAA